MMITTVAGLGEVDMVRSVSISPIDDTLDDLDDPETDYETVWRVIKFVAALKRNSRKRQCNWVNIPCSYKLNIYLKMGVLLDIFLLTL